MSKKDPTNYGGLVDINLVGLAIGNGWMSPMEQGKYASYLYYHGLLDGDQYLTLLDLEDDLIDKVQCVSPRGADCRFCLWECRFMYSVVNLWNTGFKVHRRFSYMETT